MRKKNAIITGASGGIGSAIAVSLAREGYSLILIGNHSKELLQKTASACQEVGSSVEMMWGDLGDCTAAKKIMNEACRMLRKIDLLVNCAGISYVGLLTDMSDTDWSKILNSNLSSVFYTCRAVIPYMVHEKCGQIINISSIWGIHGASCEVAYSATKGGINAFTKALAKELAPSNIAVNALACGMIDTPMNNCFSEEEIHEICEEIPAGRMGTPDEVAKAVLSLANTSSYLTGQIITIDGGWQ